jgi:translation initiation factor 4A
MEQQNTTHPPAEEENKAAHGDNQDDEVPFETNWDETVQKFDDLNLKEEVLRGIYGYGFEKPSPIQQKAILPVIMGKDTIAQA